MKFFKKARYGSLKDETSLKMIQQNDSTKTDFFIKL
jgi:hypothetical protein